MKNGDHALAGAHDMAQVRRAIRLVVKEAKAVENVVKLTFELHNRGAGHHFPTTATPAALVLIQQGRDDETLRYHPNMDGRTNRPPRIASGTVDMNSAGQK